MSDGNPGKRSPAEIIVDDEYAIVSERRGPINAFVVRHRETGTLWSCHYVERSAHSWFEIQQWYAVEMPPEEIKKMRDAEKMRQMRIETIRAVADLLGELHGKDRFAVAQHMVDSGWRAFVERGE